MVAFQGVFFPSAGERCAGRLYAPAQVGGRLPCVVMAHGTTGTMDLGLDRYAERFAASGYAVLMFDYRHFGESEGRPRQWVSIAHQLEDWEAAIRFARGLPRVDPDRIALWGTSLSAGHVVTLSAGDPAPAAVVAQLPFLGIEPRRASTRPAGVTRGLLAAAIRDGVRAVLHRAPVTVPMVGRPGEVAVFTGAGDAEAIATLAARAPQWRNEMVARSLFALIRYRPVTRAARVRIPLLVCVAEDDTAVSTALAVRAAREAPRGELRRYPGGHFAAYLDPVFGRMVTDQVAFLNRHLTPIRAATSAHG